MVSDANFDVFLSYNALDRQLVEPIAEQLQQRKCSSFIDQWYLKPGHDWVVALERALRSSRSVAVFYGSHEMTGWQQRERAWALDRMAEQPDFRVLPVLLPGCEPPLDFLKQLSWIDLRSDPADPAQLDAFAAAVRGETPQVADQLEPRQQLCPYRGLLSFREEDADFFFGRDDYLQKLQKLVQRESLVAVVGASGSGKSSLVAAGLVPQLRRRSDGRVWEIARMVPHVDPLYSLAEALVPLIEPQLSGLSLERQLGGVANDLEQDQPATSLWGLANAVLRQQPGTQRLLLVVDQWEELYTSCESAQRRTRFLAELLEATARHDSPLSAVLTVRSDFVGQLYQDRPLLDRLQNAELKLGPMNADELRAAIEGPAKQVGLKFQDGLVDRILRDAGEEPGRLPLVEFALQELWKRREGYQLTHAGYEDLGQQIIGGKSSPSVGPQRDCLSQAIATYAEGVYAQLSPEEQAALPGLFRKLVHAGSKPDEDTRRRVSLVELDITARQVARHLADQRLLITSNSSAVVRREAASEASADGPSTLNDRATSVEVAHEALLRRWQRLQDWVEADREFLQWRGRIDRKVDEYQRDGHAALLAGKPLDEARKHYPSRSADLEEDARQYLDASLSAARRRKAFVVTSMVVSLILALASAAVWYRSSRIATVQGHVIDLRMTSADGIDRHLEQLEPYGRLAVTELIEGMQEENVPDEQRAHLVYGLIHFDQADAKAVQALLDTIPMLPREEGRPLVEAILKVHKRQSLSSEFRRRIEMNKSDADRNRYLIVALQAGIAGPAVDVCRLQADPTYRTSLIDGLKDFPGNLERLKAVLEDPACDPDLRSALCLGLGVMGTEAAEATGATLQTLYQTATDGGTHSAADWALRRVVFTPDTRSVQTPGPTMDRGWWHTEFGVTFIKIPAKEQPLQVPPIEGLGEPTEDAERQLKVNYELWISSREVSIGLFQRFMLEKKTDQPPNDWEGPELFGKEIADAGNYPVQKVSWEDAELFCKWLTQHFDGYTVRLPLEKEWEYACRAMTTTAYCYGEDAVKLSDYAVFNQAMTRPCGSLRPNGWGLFDMHGNVWEWCKDSLGDGSSRVYRGGSWIIPAGYCRSALRGGSYPSFRNDALGFRLALVPSSQAHKNGGDEVESDSRQAERAEAEPTR